MLTSTFAPMHHRADNKKFQRSDGLRFFGRRSLLAVAASVIGADYEVRGLQVAGATFLLIFFYIINAL